MGIPGWLSKGLAEFTASMVYMMIGCMGYFQTVLNKNDNMTTGLNFGLAIMIAYHCFVCVSGAHINPCVSLAAIVLEKVKWNLGLIYMLCQLIGTATGFLIAYALKPDDTIRSISNVPLAATTPSNISGFHAFALEMFLTATLIFSMNGVWHDYNAPWQDSTSLRIGLIVGGLTIAGGYLTGSSLNPFRTLVPALVGSEYKGIWVYLAGPLLGAVLAAVICRVVGHLLQGTSRSTITE